MKTGGTPVQPVVSPVDQFRLWPPVADSRYGRLENPLHQPPLGTILLNRSQRAESLPGSVKCRHFAHICSVVCLGYFFWSAFFVSRRKPMATAILSSSVNTGTSANATCGSIATAPASGTNFKTKSRRLVIFQSPFRLIGASHHGPIRFECLKSRWPRYCQLMSFALPSACGLCIPLRHATSNRHELNGW